VIAPLPYRSSSVAPSNIAIPFDTWHVRAVRMVERFGTVPLMHDRVLVQVHYV